MSHEEQLNERNKELAKILFAVKQNLDIYKLIGLNTEELNKIPGNSFLGHVQWSSMKLISLDICKIYEEEKHNPLNSIHGIFKIIKTKKLAIKNGGILKNFVTLYGKEGTDCILDMENIINDFMVKHASNMEKYKNHRDKHVAHAEAHRLQDRVEGLPSFAVMEELLKFGAEFYTMVAEAYIGVGPVRIMQDKQVFSSMYLLFQELGLKDIKKDFTG